MNRLVDTHCHIQSILSGSGDFTSKKWRDGNVTDPDVVIKEAAQAGVGKLICVGTDVEDSKNAVDLVINRENCYAAVGVHPHESKRYGAEDAALRLESLVRRGQSSGKVVAIGEIGLDYHYEHSPRKQQVALLEQLLGLAQKSGLPAIFHIREAFEDFWPIFDNFESAGQRINGVLHSFSSDVNNLEKALDRGLYIGLNGIMTFTKDENQLKVAKAAPINRLLLETDAPYLTPKPLRGKVCKPQYIKLICEFLCELRGESFEQLAKNTTNNANELFKIK
jgi:TatD DNase family protein